MESLNASSPYGTEYEERLAPMLKTVSVMIVFHPCVAEHTKCGQHVFPATAPSKLSRMAVVAASPHITVILEHQLLCRVHGDF